ncbi:hypothetical protein QIA25_04955 (plasmid) [Borreliella spielmanii]|nr:hypothetical protein [Borreliella spielmanii]
MPFKVEFFVQGNYITGGSYLDSVYWEQYF